MQTMHCLSLGNISDINTAGQGKGSLLLVETMEGLLAQIMEMGEAELGEAI